MSAIGTPNEPQVIYPDSDGQLMADNTLQFRWIVTIKDNLEQLFRDQPDVFVAGDNLIYPVKGDNKTRLAPDVYVAFGRPKGDRGSYKVWEEANVFPQVVFEVRSPGNRAGEMARKLAFYDQYGAEEYYDYDPDNHRLRGYVRVDGVLDDIPELATWVSPRLGIRFDMTGPELVISGPNRERFLTFQELADAREAERQRADVERQRADAERQRADAERQRADQAGQEAERLRTMLRAAGIDPDKRSSG
jgi:Uma2 family endonuclease